MEPIYIKTYETGLLDRKIETACRIMKRCALCPRRCKVDRTSGETGFCKTGNQAVVASFHLHFGEERPLVMASGSGTIFFSRCNLLCAFCQNFDISHGGEGVAVTDENLAGIMLSLQREGALNINFVTPSHVVPMILSALKPAIENGLRIPLVYNTGGYDSVSTLRLLDGIVDIYMPDFKFWESAIAERACTAPDYRDIACKALKEMHRQVGDLVLDRRGTALRGLLVRHLVMPGGLAGTRDVMRFLHREISPHTYVNIMSQYRPCGRAFEIPEIARSISTKEFKEALRATAEEGITRLDKPGFTLVLADE